MHPASQKLFNAGVGRCRLFAAVQSEAGRGTMKGAEDRHSQSCRGRTVHHILTFFTFTPHKLASLVKYGRLQLVDSTELSFF